MMPNRAQRAAARIAVLGFALGAVGACGTGTSGYRHVLFGLSVRDGAVKVDRGIPAPDGHPQYDQQRPALAIDAGRVTWPSAGCTETAGSTRGRLSGYRCPAAAGPSAGTPPPATRAPSGVPRDRSPGLAAGTAFVATLHGVAAIGGA
ncbi:MAG TPA: hypothetical protein VKG80_13920 [Trebonia sp.]|nr:hypothetical protein [Trebonia sp.]